VHLAELGTFVPNTKIVANKIHYATNSTLDLIGFTDSDWASDSIDRKSTFGYSLSLGSGPISRGRVQRGS
jgi:hypothetical protein